MSDGLQLIDLKLTDPSEAMNLVGTNDSHLRQLEAEFDVSVITRGEQVRVKGSQEGVDLVREVVSALLKVIRRGQDMSERDLLYASDLARLGKRDGSHG